MYVVVSQVLSLEFENCVVVRYVLHVLKLVWHTDSNEMLAGVHPTIIILQLDSMPCDHCD